MTSLAVRLVAALALAAFGALAWGDMVAPAAPGRMLGAVGAGLALALALAATRHLARRARALAVSLLVLAGAVAALLLAGIPLRLFDPEHWGTLLAGLAQGIEALPTATIPYKGVEEWNRIALLVGGTLLAVAGLLLVVWPRRDGAHGRVAAAAVALAALYAVPAVELGADRPWAEGVLFAALLSAFVFADRFVARDAPLATAVLACAALGAVAIAPRLDAADPWFDYEAFAEDLSQGGMSSFSWEHGYGPLDWPRDGREVLRVRSDESAYWKATTLTEFDGTRWTEVGDGGLDGDPVAIIRRPRWVSDVRVTVRDLRTRQFIGAGTTLEISRSPRTVVAASSGSFVTSGRPLQRGHAYLARVYVPRPDRDELAAEEPAYPGGVWPYLTMRLPSSVGGPDSIDTATGLPSDEPEDAAVVVFPPFGDRARPSAFNGRSVMSGEGARLVRGSAYARTFALARRLAAESDTPYEYVRAVQAYLRRGFTYTESPGERRVPLASFLLRDKEGYCQQFSGAMALLLRMGGVPARVAAGFSPGTYDKERKEYTVRDVDAHSWVEAFFPTFGWVTFDPTPGEAPARSQVPGTGGTVPGGPSPDDSTLGVDRTSDPAGIDAGSAAGNGPPLLALAGGAAVLALLAAGGAMVARDRRRRAALGPEAAVAELAAALRRTGRRPPPGATLNALEQTLGRSAPRAVGYLRALRSQRYAGEGGGPTRAQRRALRRELGRGLGVGGRLRALRALPPW